MELNVTIQEEQVDKVYSGMLTIGQHTIMYTLTYHHGITPLDDRGNFIPEIKEGDYATLILKKKDGQQILVPKNVSDLLMGQLGLALLPIHEYRKGELNLGIPEPVAEMIRQRIPIQTEVILPIIEGTEDHLRILEDIVRWDASEIGH